MGILELRRLDRYWPVILIIVWSLYAIRARVAPRRPDMNTSASLASAIRGPFLLITLGVLIALDQFNGVSFGRTWPVLLIVFGLFKLMEKTGTKQA